jgi:hypothetical protein
VIDLGIAERCSTLRRNQYACSRRLMEFLSPKGSSFTETGERIYLKFLTVHQNIENNRLFDWIDVTRLANYEPLQGMGV